MEKLNKIFNNGEVLNAEELNQLSSKVDELVEKNNTDEQSKKSFAERPVSGYENFHVSVNYNDENLTSQRAEITDTPHMYDDYGVIALPRNYSPNKPTDLIIYCMGTGTRVSSNTNPLEWFGWKYLLAKGFAVMDMNGISPSWGNAKGFPTSNQHFCHKHLLQVYKKGFEYVANKYNLNRRVFVFGQSMGGGAMALIAQSGILEVGACCGFCPALSVYKQDYMRPWNGVNQQKTIAAQWGFPLWESTPPSQEYFLQNIGRIKGYDNLLMNTFGSQADINLANDHYNDEEERNAYLRLSKYFPCPIKIWHAVGDGTVLHRYSEIFVKMIQNGGGRAWLRSYSEGDHIQGWDNGTVQDTDYEGKLIETSTNFYEAAQFINRYRQ